MKGWDGRGRLLLDLRGIVGLLVLHTPGDDGGYRSQEVHGGFVAERGRRQEMVVMLL